MTNSRVAACFAVAGVQVYLLDIKKLSSPNIQTTVDGKVGSPIEKISLLGIIFALNLGL